MAMNKEEFFEALNENSKKATEMHEILTKSIEGKTYKHFYANFCPPDHRIVAGPVFTPASENESVDYVYKKLKLLVNAHIKDTCYEIICEKIEVAGQTAAINNDEL